MSFNAAAVAIFSATTLWVVVLLAIEFYQLKSGKPLITTIMRDLVKRLPWPFILFALTSGFMMGHCFAN